MYLGYYSSMIVLIPALIFTIIAQSNIKNTYRIYSGIRNSRGITGAEAARRMLEANGLGWITINAIGGGELTNYYNPKDKTLNLSGAVYSSASIASICIACHEVGHAIQDAEAYTALSIRNTLVPIVNFTQTISWPLIVVGLIMTTTTTYGSILFNIGVICFAVVVLFHLVTLPVEFNASSRALNQLQELDMVDEKDYQGSKKVLKAAAMTYVAALATAVANLLRIILMSKRRN